MYATSKAVDNPSYYNELRYILDTCGLKYEIIHMNNGLHGLHQTIEAYKIHYEKALNYIQSVSQQSKVILALSTPITKVNLVEEYDEKNFIVQDRNLAIRQLGRKYNLQINDLYEAAADNCTIRKDDGFHYFDKGY